MFSGGAGVPDGGLDLPPPRPNRLRFQWRIGAARRVSSCGNGVPRRCTKCRKRWHRIRCPRTLQEFAAWSDVDSTREALFHVSRPAGRTFAGICRALFRNRCGRQPCAGGEGQLHNRGVQRDQTSNRERSGRIDCASPRPKGRGRHRRGLARPIRLQMAAIPRRPNPTSIAVRRQSGVDYVDRPEWREFSI